MRDLGFPQPSQYRRNPRYINRELSWLQFNSRVLAEAEREDNPLLERAKFLAIFESNLDEFFMVRVSGLFEQLETGFRETSFDGMTVQEQVSMIRDVTVRMRARANWIWEEDLQPALAKQGIRFVNIKKLKAKELEELDQRFDRDIFPLCTPLLLDPSVTFPFISNLSLNLAVQLKEENGSKLARVKIPPNIDRALSIPGRESEFVLLEEVIKRNLPHLFPGVGIGQTALFRVIRDADIEIREFEAADLIRAVEHGLRMRRFGDPVLLEHQSKLTNSAKRVLVDGLELDANMDTIDVEGLVGLGVLWELYKLDRPDLKYPTHRPFKVEDFDDSDTLLAECRKQDILFHHPFDSFDPIETFVESAVYDDNVVGIKQTLYRVGSQSPVVESLLKAAEAGKQVAVMVELKARFDESNNLVWSRALERAGVHVTYGTVDMKTHCKLCLIVRKEEDQVRLYAHIGTGNYNPITSRLYTDIGLLTTDTDICQDVSELFNYLTGYSKQLTYRRLLVAPLDMRERVIEKIERETKNAKAGKPARLIFKINSLVDPEVIDSLFSAAEAGVVVDLICRGICCLRPSYIEQSSNIKVVSIVGQFLEHSRIYYFENAGEPEVFIGSADLMPRNLDRRIEVLSPVSDPSHIEYLRDEVLEHCLKDNVNAWMMGSDDAYRRRANKGSKAPFAVQQYLMKKPAQALALPI